MSAACAPDIAPNIIAASTNLRIATLHRTHYGLALIIAR
jgi:hypothetical protein